MHKTQSVFISFEYNLLLGLCVFQQMRGKLTRMTAGEQWVEHQQRALNREQKMEKMPQSDPENWHQVAERSE